MQEIVKLLNVVYADVQCVSGAVSKSHNSGDEVFTDGSVRYMNPKLLRPFARARQAATRLCRQHGERFLSGWAVPDESLKEVREGLAAISRDVAREKAILMNDLHTHRMEWSMKHPEILAFQSKFKTDKEIEENIAMFVSIYKIEPSTVEHEGLQDGIQVEVLGLGARVLAGIAKDVRDSWSPDAQGATTRSRGVLERIALKLERMSFISGDLSEVADMIQKSLDVLPSSGPIKGQDFLILSGLMNTLSDPDKVVRTARISANENPHSMWVSYGQQDVEIVPIQSAPDVDEGQHLPPVEELTVTPVTDDSSDDGWPSEPESSDDEGRDEDAAPPGSLLGAQQSAPESAWAW